MNFTFHPVYALAGLLLALAVYFGYRQVRTLRGLRQEENLPPEDRRYFRSQAVLRLVSCGLLVVLAGLMAGAYLFGLETSTDRLIEERQAANAQAKQPLPTSPEEKRQINRYTLYWVGTILVLLVVVCLAVVDLWGIRRFGLRHYRKIQADRRAMIQRQVAIFRSQRNGHG